MEFFFCSSFFFFGHFSRPLIRATIDGFGYDVLTLLAQALDANFSYVSVDSFSDIVRGVEQSTLDTGLPVLSVTAARYPRVLFSVAVLGAGVGAMTAATLPGVDVATLLLPFNWDIWITILLLSVAIAVALFIITATSYIAIERRLAREQKDNHPTTVFTYGKMFLQSFSSVQELFVGGDINAHRENTHNQTKELKWITQGPIRIFLFGWGVSVIVLIAVYTATLSAILSRAQAQSQLSTVRDLRGRLVDVVAGSTSEDLARKENAVIRTSYSDADLAFASFQRGPPTARKNFLFWLVGLLFLFFF